MINWGLIEATLDTAISDAECALAQRRKDYAGFEHLADLPQHEEELQDARRARDEVAKLKKLIAEAPRAVIDKDGFVSTPPPSVPGRMRNTACALLPLDDEAKS